MHGVAPRLRREAETIYDVLKGFKSRLELWREENGKSISNMLSSLDEREAIKRFRLNQQICQAWTGEEDTLIWCVH
jgi:hypothetical protein